MELDAASGKITRWRKRPEVLSKIWRRGWDLNLRQFKTSNKLGKISLFANVYAAFVTIFNQPFPVVSSRHKSNNTVEWGLFCNIL
jgi:hypothetical protein